MWYSHWGCCPGAFQPQAARAAGHALSLRRDQQAPLLRWKAEWVRHPEDLACPMLVAGSADSDPSPGRALAEVSLCKALTSNLPAQKIVMFVTGSCKTAEGRNCPFLLRPSPSPALQPVWLPAARAGGKSSPGEMHFAGWPVTVHSGNLAATSTA